jgi:hypothetical protein
VNEEVIPIVNPTAERETKSKKLAPRKFATLRQRRVGLLDNNKPNADKFLEQIGALLKQRYDGVELIALRKTTRTAVDCLKELSERCDVVINAFAD